jgi:hypothetical protein
LIILALSKCCSNDGNPIWDSAEVSLEGEVWYDQGPYKRIREMREGSDASRQNYTDYTIAYPKMRKKGLKNSWLLTTRLLWTNKPEKYRSGMTWNVKMYVPSS